MTDEPDWATLRDMRAVVPSHVVFRGFAQETVLLNISTGEYHGLDQVGGRFFEVATGAKDLRSASAALAAEYGQPASRIDTDLAMFCTDLRQRGLIELQPAG